MELKEKTAAAVLSVLVVSMIAAISSATDTIAGYYNSIPITLLNGHRYPLLLEHKTWVSKSSANYQIKPIVDIANGYIEITDTGTGGGTVSHVLALFKSLDGKDTIGVHLTDFDGVKINSTLKFYRPGFEGWKDITDDVLPKLDMSLFVYEKEDLEGNGAVGAYMDTVGLKYQLPRIGTTVHVSVDADTFAMLAESKEYGTASELVGSLRYKDIALIWDQKNAGFRLGEKTAHPLSVDGTERRGILDALRKCWPGQDVTFAVRYLKVNKGWAWIHALPRSRDGMNRYEDVSGLLGKTKGLWKLVETRPVECGDDPACADDARYFNRLKSRFPSASMDIFP